MKEIGTCAGFACGSYISSATGLVTPEEALILFVGMVAAYVLAKVSA